MDIENGAIQEWIAALRSGAYLQGPTFLRIRNSYCCLGVACELYRHHFDDLEITTFSDETWWYDGCGFKLPPKVRAWLGLASDVGIYFLKGGATARNLAMDNDTGKSFAEIANIIEANLESLCKRPVLNEGEFNDYT